MNGLSLQPRISILIATHNRRDVLLNTLSKLMQLPESTQIILIDNDSTDSTVDAVMAQFPSVLIVRQETNRGACAKNVGLPLAQGEFVVFLDDDSYPMDGSLSRMVEHFRNDPRLGATIFDVVLKDGSHECSAYPTVFAGCGVGFRKEAILQAGGLPDDYFYQAEEYDLTLRLLDCGWEIRRFDNLSVMHLKTTTARKPARTTRLDARNNLTLATRFFPRQWVKPFVIDWMRRYHWLSKTKDRRHRLAFWVGVFQGLLRSARPGHRRPVSEQVFEQFAMIERIDRQMNMLVRQRGYRKILFVDLSKNILPYYLAAQRNGLEIVAITDQNLGKSGLLYHGIPIIEDSVAAALRYDAAIISNSSPVHAEMRLAQLPTKLRRPVIDLLRTPEPMAKVA